MRELDMLAEAASTAALSTSCQWWPMAFEINASAPDVVSWVRAHLCVTLTPRRLAPAEVPVSIHVSDDSRLMQGAAALLARTDSTLIEGFHGQFWRRFAVDGLTLWFCEANLNGPLLIARLGNRAWMVVATSSDFAMLSTIRLCRELHRMRMAELKASAVHASFAVVDGIGGTLFLGASGAGKTTLALALAQRHGYVVSSDQTFVMGDDAGSVIGVGVPNANRLGAGTFDLLTRQAKPGDLALLRDTTAAYDGGGAREKRWITVLESEVMHRIPSAAASVIDRIVVLERTPAPGTLRLLSLAQDELSLHLSKEFREPDPLYAGMWLVTEGHEAPTSANRFSELLALAEKPPRHLLRWDPLRHDVFEALHLLEKDIN